MVDLSDVFVGGPESEATRSALDSVSQEEILTSLVELRRALTSSVTSGNRLDMFREHLQAPRRP